MPKCIIDGQEVEFSAGENLVEVAKKIGIEIPVFCYHPGLSVVAQCRMCTVEVEKMGKLQTGCSTVATEGMVVHTQSEKVKKNRESVMEFLLINHPLDCPICDKSGECDLQDHSFDHGSSYMRTTESRRTYLDLDMGPVIKKNMNRCIHCTRCIRLGEEVTHIREMVALQRGNNTEISTIDGRALETDYAANYADVCPTGSLTLKDFRFNKRVWMLKKTPTICEGCSRGCNMEAHWDAGQVHRCIPRENLEINRYWLCDEGRFNFHYTHDETRIIQPQLRSGGVLSDATWNEALEGSKNKIKGKSCVFLIGSDLTQEEVEVIKGFVNKSFQNAPMFHFGTPNVKTSAQDTDEDKILKRTSKTSNLNGLEKLGLKAFDTVPSGVEYLVIFKGGRAQLPQGVDQFKKVGFGVFFENEKTAFDVIFPGATFLEKSGTVLNYQNKEQKFNRAIPPPKTCKYFSEVFMLWDNVKQNKSEHSMGVA